MTESTALASFRANLDKEIANVGKTINTGAAKIKAKNHTFTLPDGTASNKPIEVIILDYFNAHAYYENAYNSKKIEPPTCFSSGKMLADMTPSTRSTDQQSDACDGCPHNEFATAANGGDGKRCTQSVKLAIVPPTADGSEEPIILNVPATSLRSWGNYVSGLSMDKLHTTMVITEIAFDTSVDHNKFMFKKIGTVKNLEQVMPLHQAALSILAN